MDIVLNILVFALGVFVLIKSADYFVDAASLIARKLKISPLIIGLTIVALGTSLPEFAVSLSGALKSTTTADLSLGNIVGSNIANITLILGISALMSPILVQKSIIKRDLPYAILTAVTLFILAFFFQIDKKIVWWEALIFIALLAVYIFLLIRSSKNGSKDDLEVPNKDAEPKVVEEAKFSYFTIVFLILGAVGIALGAELVTRPATFLAEKMATGLGLDPSKATILVGVSVVAIGTSLPELATSIAAARKKENGIVLGNILGSNILNILFILGITGLFVPLGVSPTIMIDMVIMIAISLFAAVLIFRRKLGKVEGLILLTVFVSYMTYVIIRTIA
ncbi:MAG TPA: calcium/sodium antiporter [Bacilli bacterium]|nr:calcium/sodium antiporter [Bacilli bacterium]